jgi:hypothetical protein
MITAIHSDSNEYSFDRRPVEIEMPKKKEVKEQAIVFFLRIPENIEGVVPVQEQQTYSEIITVTEEPTRFGNDILKPILLSIQNQTVYSEHIHCFWCCHEFTTQTFTLPISFDTNKNLFVCSGIYCSPECALAYLYADVNISDNSRWQRHALLSELYKPLYGEREISIAPPRSILRIFGGPLDIKQFREYVTSTCDVILSELPPIRMAIPSMNIQGPLRDIKKYVSISNDAIDKASEALRLKRSKPAVTSVLTLDMCIK